MPPFSTEFWILLSIIALHGVIAMLFTIACKVRNELMVYDLRIKAINMRNDYLTELQEKTCGLPTDQALISR